MMKLKSLFRRGHGPPTTSNGARSGKRGAGPGSGAPAPAAPPAAGPEAGNGAHGLGANGVGSLPRQLPPQPPQEVLVRSFGSAEIPVTKTLPAPQPPPLAAAGGEGRDGALKGAASISSLDSKHHKFQLPQLPKQLQLRGGSKSRAPAPTPAPSAALDTHAATAAASGGAATQTVAPAANNNNKTNINNNHNKGSELELVQGELEKVSRDKQQLQQRVEELSGCQGELQSLRQEVARLRVSCHPLGDRCTAMLRLGSTRLCRGAYNLSGGRGGAASNCLRAFLASLTAQSFGVRNGICQ